MSKKFYICRHCGNIIEKINDAGVPVMCCGEKMEELIPNTSDGAGEKHVPAVAMKDGILKVNVGEVDHPMLDAHYIVWVYVETERGGMYKKLQPGEAPNVSFAIGDDKVIAVYEYCNIHGLWVKEVK